MKENVVPIDQHVALQRQTVEFAEWLRGALERNEVSAMCVRGIGTDGEVFQYDVVALGSQTLRLLMIGQLHEAAAMLTVDE